jgi:hypothetical protein
MDKFILMSVKCFFIYVKECKLIVINYLSKLYVSINQNLHHYTHHHHFDLLQLTRHHLDQNRCSSLLLDSSMTLLPMLASIATSSLVIAIKAPTTSTRMITCLIPSISITIKVIMSSTFLHTARLCLR